MDCSNLDDGFYIAHMVGHEDSAAFVRLGPTTTGRGLSFLYSDGGMFLEEGRIDPDIVLTPVSLSRGGPTNDFSHLI